MSKTIARPELGNMFVDTSAETQVQQRILVVFGGVAVVTRNWIHWSLLTSISPLSTTMEKAVRYRLTDKQIANFIGTEEVQESLFGITDVASGQPGTVSGAAVAALAELGWDATKQTSSQ